MNDQQKILLLNKYIDGTLDEQEEIAFFTWFHEVNAGEFHQLLAQASGNHLPPVYEEASPTFLAQLDRKLGEADKERENKGVKIRRLSAVWWSAAAIILVLAGTWTIFRPSGPEKKIAAGTAIQDIAPGKNGAVLTLADGRKITLDSLGDGQIASQGGTSLILQNGSLSYNATNASDVSYNTVSTPPSRQFRLVLPDGSKVWLNAMSSLKYPTAFTGRDRTVEIKGEAYFEVIKDADRPFKVKAGNNTEIAVLGTHFNINAYYNENSIRATLLEGSIRVSKDASGAVLQPGQQAEIKGTLHVHDKVNTGQVVAWKDGIFNFDGMGIEEVMRQLARWYDIEVIYEKHVPPIQFYGEIGRNLNLSQVLEGLKLSGVNFRIEDGKRLVVLP